MGFFDDYDVDIDNYEATNGFEVPDGNYDFEITKAEIRKGTTKDPEAVNITVSYRLENAEGAVFSYMDWFKIPADPDHPTTQENIAMGNFKKLLISAKVEDLQNAGPEDLEGLTGTLRLVSSQNKKTDRTYQNPRDIRFDTSDEKPAAAKTSAPAAAAKPAGKAGNPFVIKA